MTETRFAVVAQEVLPPHITVEGEAWLTERGISASTALACGVSTAPGRLKGEDTELMSFPYTHEGHVYAQKIRGKNKAFTQKGAASTFWLSEDVIPGDDLVIVEGEMDALTLREVGCRSVVSAPNGAPVKVSEQRIDPEEDRKFQYVWHGKHLFDQAGRIILAGDADKPGEALMEELARRIGKARCWRVVWPDGCKDANDVLLKLGPQKLQDVLDNPEPWPIAGVYDANHFGDQVRKLYAGGLGKGVSPGIDNLYELYSICPGHLTVVTGVPGSGKSSFLNQVAVNCADQMGWNIAIYSSETPPEIHIPMLSAIHMGKPFFEGITPRMNEAELDDGIAWVNQHFLFLHSDETCTYEQVIERLKVAVMRKGIRGFIVDPANYLKRSGVDDVEWVGQMLEAFRNFAQSHGCHAWIVAHPKKPADGSVVGGYAISGSAHWYNRPDFGLTIHRVAENRSMTEFHVWKVRFAWTGQEGKAELYHDRATGRYDSEPFGHGSLYAATEVAGLDDDEI